MDKIKQLVEKYTKRAVELRREIHQNPELSHHEELTGALIAEELREIGMEVIDNLAGAHGVLGIIHGGKPGRTIALRADMDALSMTENTGLPFSSNHEGRMHACGHDGHMAILLGTAHILWDMRQDIAGTIKLVFQPAEESAPEGGARAIVSAGILDNVDGIYGLHVWPDLPTGKIGVKAGPMMAASDHITVSITGKSSHGAMPHNGIDAIVAAAQFITAVQSLVSRRVDPMEQAVITFGKISGGDRYNIVADSVVIDGTCRTFNPHIQDMIEKKLSDLLIGLDSMYDTQSTLHYERGYAPLINSPEQASLIRRVIIERFGENAVANIQHPAMTAEDFSVYKAACPIGFCWLGTAKPNVPVYPLHNTNFTIDEDILPIGMELLSATALNALNE